MERLFFISGCGLAMLAVGLGAFGAHAFRRHFETHADLLPIFKTATEYHMYHALALLGVAWAASRWPAIPVTWSGYLFLFGIVVFSGSLYVLSISNVRAWGAVTPIGGVAFLAGWLCLAIGALKSSGGQ